MRTMSRGCVYIASLVHLSLEEIVENKLYETYRSVGDKSDHICSDEARCIHALVPVPPVLDC